MLLTRISQPLALITLVVMTLLTACTFPAITTANQLPPSLSTPTPTSTPTPCADATTTIALNTLYGWPEEVGNHVKIFDIALDATRHRIYVQGILTPGIAVIDSTTDAFIGQIDSGLGDQSFHRTYLAVDEVSGALYVADHSGRTLRKIDPDTGEILGPVQVNGEPIAILLDPSSQRLFLSLKLAHKIAVFDMTTLTHIADINTGPALPGDMTLDPIRGRLLVVDARPPIASTSNVLVYQINNLQPLPPIRFRNTTGHPASSMTLTASGDLFVTTPEELFRIQPNGSVVWMTGLPDNAKKPYFWPETNSVYVISRNGLSKIRSTLTVVDASTGQPLEILDLQTGGAQHMVLDETTGKIYTPGMEFTEVVVVDAKTVQVVKKIDIGNTVEDIAYAPTDGALYLANRLGGSTILAYQPATGNWQEFTTGGWPTAVDVDPGLNRLFILNHYAGTVTAFDLADPLHPTQLGVTPLGLQDVSDAISNQTLDEVRHRVITTHPEHDRIVIVDGQTLQVLKTIADVPYFAYDAQTMHGRGHLQPAVETDFNKLYVFVRSTGKVIVFDGAKDYAYLHAIDLREYAWNSEFHDFQIVADSERHRIYVGPIIIDAVTDRVIGRLPANRGQVVVGIDAIANQLFTVDIDAQSGRYMLYRLDRDTYDTLETIALRRQRYVSPYFALDVQRHRLLVGYMQTAEVDIYPLECREQPPLAPSPTTSFSYLPFIFLQN